MNYNKSGLGILVAGVLASFVCFFYILFFAPPIKLAQLEGETTAEGPDTPSAESSPKASADSSGSAQAGAGKPWVASPSTLAEGKKAYQTYCFSCHGQKGLGDGPAGGALKPPPRNLVEGKWQQGGSSIALYKTLAQGIEGTSMVSFSYLSKEDRWALVHYVRSITQNKVEDNLEELEKFAKTAP